MYNHKEVEGPLTLTDEQINHVERLSQIAKQQGVIIHMSGICVQPVPVSPSLGERAAERAMLREQRGLDEQQGLSEAKRGLRQVLHYVAVGAEAVAKELSSDKASDDKAGDDKE